MVHYIIFISIAVLLLVCLVLTQFHWLFLLLFILWLLRIVFLKKLVVFFTTLIIVVFMSVRLYDFEQNNQSQLSGDETSFVVKVDRLSVKIDGDSVQFYGEVVESNVVDNIGEKIVAFYTIETEEKKDTLLSEAFPELVLVQGELRLPNSRRNFHQFDYRKFLNRRQIYWTLEAESYRELNVQVENSFHPKQWRYQLLTWVSKNMPDKTAEYVNMLLFSDMRTLDSDMQDHFSNLGIIHMISISGMNIALFIEMIRYGLLRIGFSRERVPFILLGFLPIYGVLTGLGVSVFRAIVQHGLKAMGQIFDWSFDPLDYWSLTLLLGLFIDPNQIFSAGFQFSYLLSFMLYMLQEIPFMKSIPNSFQDTVLSGVLSLVSIPILSFHYFEFPWYSLLANSLFAPFFNYFLLPGALIALLVALIPIEFLKNILFNLFELGIALFEFLVQEMGNWPGLTFVTGRLPIIAMILLVISIVWLIIICEKEKNKIISIIGVSSSIVLALLANKLAPFAQVIMLDVNQGDSIVLIEPFMQSTTLIDTGGQLTFEEAEWQKSENVYRIGDRVVVPSLKALGVSQLDHVIISHGDADHMGELEIIMDHIKIDQLIVSAPTAEILLADRLKYSNLENTNQLILEENDLVQLENKLYVIAPENNDMEKESKNNASLVAYGKIQDDWWLFTGDIEENREKSFVKSFPDLKVDVLKVAHHGSDTSTTEVFLNQYQPNEALISVGKNNWYNHPNNAVIDRLTQRNIKIYRTDQDGAIRYKYHLFEPIKEIQTVVKKEGI